VISIRKIMKTSKLSHALKKTLFLDKISMSNSSDPSVLQKATFLKSHQQLRMFKIFISTKNKTELPKTLKSKPHKKSLKISNQKEAIRKEIKKEVKMPITSNK